RSLAWNGAAGRCDVRFGDFRDPALTTGLDSIDLVTGTPPYLTPGRATASRRAQCGPCHFEERGGVEEYCATAAHLLAADGRFVVCAAAFQHERVAIASRRAGLIVEACVPVIPRAGKEVLFAVYVMHRDGAARRDRASRPSVLVVRDRLGQWTTEFAG